MGLSLSNLNSSRVRPSSQYLLDELVTMGNLPRITSIIPKHISSVKIELYSTLMNSPYKKRHSYCNNEQNSHYIYLKCEEDWHFSMEFKIISMKQTKQTHCIKIKISKEYKNVIKPDSIKLLQKNVRCEIMDIIKFGVEKFLKEIEVFGLLGKNSQHFANFIYFNRFKSH